MKNKFGFFIVGVLLVVFSFLEIAPRKVIAADDNVTITLHKLLFDNGDVPDQIQNDGLTNPFLSENYEGVNGVTFTVYEVSDAFYKLRNEGLSVEQAQKKLATDVSSGRPVKTKVTKEANGEAGIATFSLPHKTAEGKYEVYRFVETAHPDNISVSSTPLVVVLPVFDTDEQEMTAIDLYPKNEQVPYTPPKVEKKITADQKSFGNGADVPYEISTEIPVDVWEYQNFTMSDTADDALTLNADPIVKIDGKTISGAVLSMATTAHGFTINFDPQVLNNYLGKIISVSYSMHFIGLADQTDYPNIVTLTPGPHPQITHDVIVKTGGKIFIKVDTEDQDKVLADAKFVIKNADGKYLARSTEGDTWVSSGNPLTDKRLFVITSSKEGTFAINDLAYGKYSLEEIAAPDDYVLSKTAVNFTVNAESFATKTALKVVNKKTPPFFPGVPITGIFTHLPQTGEEVARSLSYLGIVLIAGVSGIWFYKKNKKATPHK